MKIDVSEMIENGITEALEYLKDNINPEMTEELKEECIEYIEFYNINVLSWDIMGYKLTVSDIAQTIGAWVDK